MEDTQITDLETLPERRKPFGAGSRYYQLYHESPAAARKELWETYLQCAKSVSATARAMGCSRHTVRRVVRRVGEGPVYWADRPTRPFDPRPQHIRGELKQLIKKLTRGNGHDLPEVLKERYNIHLPPKILKAAGWKPEGREA